MSPLRSLLALTLLALGAQIGAGHAQEAEEPWSFADSVDVEVVEVDVHVTDRQGRPVTGLTVDDFAVFEDGQPVVITNFRVVSAEAPPPARPESTAPAPEPAPAEAVPGIVQEEEERPAHLVLYVDNANIRAAHRRRVLRSLRDFVDRLQTPFRIMVVSYDRSPNLRQPFTDRPREVAEALLDLEDEPVFGDATHDDFRDLVREIEDPNAPQGWLENRVRGHAETMRFELDRSLDSLRDLVTNLAGLPGRKALVYVSDGLPLTPAEELYHALERRFQTMTVLHEAIRQNASRDFQRLAQAANTAGVTFYTLHAPGLEAPMASEAEVAGSGYDELRATVDSVRLANFQGSGRLLASETGGLAFLNQNDYAEGLGRMVGDFNEYYSLGYRPRHSGDGRYHRIEVEVKGRGLDVRHRQGYRDRSLSDRMSALVRSAVNYGFGRNPLEIDLDVAAPPAGEAGDGDIVLVRVGIPMANVVLLPRGERHESRTLLYLAVQDADGNTSPVREVDVPIRVPADRLEAALQQRWVQEVRLRVRPGPHLLVAGVWDELGRTSSVAFRRFRARP